LKKALHEEKPRDRQYIYLQPGGNYNVRKALATNPSNIFIDGRRCCAWRNCSLRVTSTSPPRASPWNGSA
jgi:hypothetical protein